MGTVAKPSFFNTCLIFLLLCLTSSSRILVPCDAATSSNLLKHAVKSAANSARPVVSWSSTAARPGGKRAAGHLGKRLFGRATASSLKSTAGVGLVAPITILQPQQAVATSSVAARTGFRSFSQRATRLQLQLQKSFSWRAIFVDVLTNNNGNGPVGEEAVVTTKAGQGHARHHHSTIMSSFGRPSIRQMGWGTASETASGFVGGYVLGVGSQLARFCGTLWQPCGSSTAAAATTLLPYSHLVQYAQQTYTCHAKSMACAVEWAHISAVFGACRYGLQWARGGTDDAWNSVGASTMAGMIFATGPHPQQLFRACPPQAMMRGALLYGGTMMMMHPHLWVTPVKERVMSSHGWFRNFTTRQLDDETTMMTMTRARR